MAISTNGTIIARLAGGLYNQTLSNASYNEVVGSVKSAADINTLANSLVATDFAGKTDAQIATVLLTNLGLTGVAGLNNWVAAQITAAGPAGKGAKIVSLLNDFSNLTSDATYGASASSFNGKVDAALELSQTVGFKGGDINAAATIAAAAKAAADKAAADAAAAKAAADKIAADAKAAADKAAADKIAADKIAADAKAAADKAAADKIAADAKAAADKIASDKVAAEKILTDAADKAAAAASAAIDAATVADAAVTSAQTALAAATTKAALTDATALTAATKTAADASTAAAAAKTAADATLVTANTALSTLLATANPAAADVVTANANVIIAGAKVTSATTAATTAATAAATAKTASDAATADDAAVVTAQTAYTAALAASKAAATAAVTAVATSKTAAAATAATTDDAVATAAATVAATKGAVAAKADADAAAAVKAAADAAAAKVASDAAAAAAKTASDAAAAAKATADAAAAKVIADALAIENAPKSFILTTGVNIFTGAGGVDTFDGSFGGSGGNLQTLNSSDTLVGGLGTDVLIASLLAGTIQPTLTSVDRLVLTATGTATVNLLDSTGVTAIENANSTAGLTVSNINSTAVTLKDSNNSNGTTFSYTTAAVASTTSDTATLTLSAVTGGTESVAGIEILNVVSTGAANTATISNSSLLTLNVSGDQNLTLGTLPATATTVSATGMTAGRLSATGANTTAMTMTGGLGADILTGAAGNDNISGGDGADSLTGAAGNDVLSGGNGADTITGGANNDNISGGDGNDILVFATNAELVADGTVSGGANTDTIRFTGDVGADINEASLVNTRISSVEALDFRGFAVAQRTVTLTDAAMTAQGTTAFTVTDGQYGDAVATGGLDINASALTAANSIDATFNNRAVSLATITTAANSVGDTVVVNVGGTAYVTYTPSAADAAANTVTDTALGIVTAINAAAAGTLVASNNAGVISIAAASPGSTLGAITFTLANTDGGSVAITNTGASVMDNSFTGGAGADTFRVLAVGGGLTSADTLAGGSGTDTLFVTGGASTATTVNMTAVSAIENITTVGTGLVTINNFHASTSLAAGATLTVNAASQTNALLGLSLNASNSGTTGLVNVTGGAGADTILGGAGADIINGGGGNDTITAGAGNDSLTGGEGDDDFVYASETAFSDDTGTTTTSDTVAGGAGNDTLQFTNAAATLSAAQLVNVTGIEIIDLAITASTITLTDAVVDANGGDIQQVRLTTAGTVTASALTAPNSIAVRVEAQTDGDVSITGGAGADSATFSGNTTGLLGATDAVKLGTGTDVIYVTNVNGHTAGTGAASAATLSSLVTGVESLVISDLATDQALGDVSITLNTTFTATTFTVDGSQLDAGEDLTFANNSTATVVPTVSVTGGAGADGLTGGSGNDTLIGGDGIDGLTGGAGIDSLVGGNGVDTFTVATLAHFAGLLSPETISGGAGNDILSITAAGTINASDLLAMNSVETISLASAGTQSVVLSDAVFTANGATTLAITEVANATISVNASGLSAANSVQITTSDTAVNQTLVGGAGNDTFTIVLGTGTIAAGDTITGGAGTDTVILGTVGNGTIDFTGVTGIETMTSAVSGAGATTDSLTFAAIPDTLLASGITLTMNFSDRTGAGSVIMNATNSEADGKFNITTGAAADTIYGGSGADTVDAGAGADTISGGAGADSLLGNAGNDSILGGTGADNLTGGTGSDVFQYTAVDQSSGAAIDTITDFSTTDDQLQVTLNYGSLISAVTVNAIRVTAGAGITEAQASLTGERGQYVYDTTASRLYVNVNNDNLLTALDYAINVNAASTATATVANTDINFIVTGTALADTITTDGGADTIDGGVGTDSIDGGAGADNITGGAGADTITGGTGSDTIVLGSDSAADVVKMASTSAAIGSDTITGFEVGAGADTLQFATLVTALTNGVTPYVVGTAAAEVALSGTVAFLTAAAVTSVDEASEIAAQIHTAAADGAVTKAFSLAASQKGVIISMVNTGTASVAYVWYVENDATAAVTAAEVTLVGTLSTTTNIANWHANQVTFI